MCRIMHACTSAESASWSEWHHVGAHVLCCTRIHDMRPCYTECAVSLMQAMWWTCGHVTCHVSISATSPCGHKINQSIQQSIYIVCNVLHWIIQLGDRDLSLSCCKHELNRKWIGVRQEFSHMCLNCLFIGLCKHAKNPVWPIPWWWRAVCLSQWTHSAAAPCTAPAWTEWRSSSSCQTSSGS